MATSSLHVMGSALYEEIRMTWPDFAEEVMCYWGARLDSDGAWRLPSGMLVSLLSQPLNPRVEPGWFRWQLPGFDGTTRGRLVDPTSPYIVRSPNGRWFWCSARGGYMTRASAWEILEKVADHAIDSGAPRGWPAR